MTIYKATSTLDGYLPNLQFTQKRSEAEVLLVGGKPVHLCEFPKLRGIFKTGVGTDNLPFDEAKRGGVRIELPSEPVRAIVYEETASFACHLIFMGLYADAGSWDGWKKAHRPHMAERTLLVVGAGRIGSRVIRKMSAFMRVDSYDVANDPPDAFARKLSEADCVSLHVPLTEDTRCLLDRHHLSLLPDGALVVNTARGPVIDEEALFVELESQRLRAALDVFWQEPYTGKLSNLPPDRFIRTPHVASTCREFLQGTAADFLRFLDELG